MMAFHRQPKVTSLKSAGQHNIPENSIPQISTHAQYKHSHTQTI